MRVGILGGTGPLGRGLALRLAAGGCEVTIGSRDPARAHELAGELAGRWPGRPLAIAGAPNAVAAGTEIVVAATPWEAAAQTVGELRDELSGKVVVSVGNALSKQGREMVALVPARGSVAASVQAALPRSMVSAAGHHLPAGPLADLDIELEADVLVCSDHPEATLATIELLGRIEGLRPLDAGSLSAAGPIEAFTAVLVSLNARYRARSSLRLWGLDSSQAARGQEPARPGAPGGAVAR
ncbi:MAG TPA: NADPH-dependent F420 reductase [Acidimicrobiales bacterium]|nr:NADPH-dependent F420 reductase [Acidimicrobiales bacterium]